MIYMSPNDQGEKLQIFYRWYLSILKLLGLQSSSLFGTMSIKTWVAYKEISNFMTAVYFNLSWQQIYLKNLRWLQTTRLASSKQIWSIKECFNVVNWFLLVFKFMFNFCRFFVVGSRDMTSRIFSLFPMNGFLPVTLSGHRNTVIGCYFAQNSLDVSLLTATYVMYLWRWPL